MKLLSSIGCLMCLAQAVWAADPAVTTIVAQVSQSSYQGYQQAIEDMGLGLYGGAGYNQGFPGRDGWGGAGSLGNQETRLYLTDQFNAMGLSVATQGVYQNIVAELPGLVTPEKVYIVSGHFDHVAGNSPGGDDNASGTAGVLEAARVLSQFRFQSTIRFIGFNAEEDGLLGSQNYVNNVVLPAGQQIAGVINLDMILRPAWDNNPSAVIDLDLGTRTSKPASVAWANLFRATAAEYVSGLAIDSTIFNVNGGSDQDPFAVANFPAFLAIENTASEIWGGANAYYHTSQDASARAAGALYDYAFASDVVRASVALLAEEAEVVPEPALVTPILLAATAGLALLWRRPRRRGA